MYNIKKIYRKKSNVFIIFIFTFLFMCLLFLFKYIFVVENDIELKIYDKHKNKELIVYENKEKVITSSQKIENIIYIYSDYQMLNIENKNLGIYTLSPILFEESPKVILGKFPENDDEIILPSYNYINNKKVELTNIINKELTFIINGNKTIDFKIVGLYESEEVNKNAYFNLYNIEELLKKMDYNQAEYTRVLVDHYKNIDKVLNELVYKAELNDISGMDEIEVYKSLFDLVLLLIVGIILFIIVVLLVVSSILYYDTMQDRYIQFVLGLNKHGIAMNYINYYLKLLIVSFSVSIFLYFFITIIYNQFILIDNLVLNDLFSISLSHKILISILFLISIILFLLYLFIRFRLSRNQQMN